MPLARKQRSLNEVSSPSFCAGRKLGEVEQALLWSRLQEDPECPSRALIDRIAKRQIPLAVSLRHVNRWRVTWGFKRGKGRPRQAEGPRPVAAGAEVIRVTPHMSCVGVHLLAHWLDHREAFGPVVAQLTQAVEAHKHTHPEEDFALLPHREPTRVRRCQALFFSPLVGRDHLSEFETRAHPLKTLRGCGYQSATLRQFLGHLERGGAAEALMPAL